MALVHSISHTSLPNSLTFSVPSLSTYVFVIVMDSHHSVQFSCSVVSNSLWSQELQHARPPCLSPTPRVHSKLMSIKSVMPSIHLNLCCPLFLLPPIPPSITVFSTESTPCMRWPKYWSFSFSIILSKEHPGLISFRMDWLDHLAFSISMASRYSCLENSLDRGAWWATVQGATKNLKELSTHIYTYARHAL